MSEKEVIEQLESLIEAWYLNEADLNQTDINAIKSLLQENRRLKEQLKQRDKVFNELTKFINVNVVEENINGCGDIIRGIWDDVYGLEKPYSEILNILNKYKGDNNEQSYEII